MDETKILRMELLSLLRGGNAHMTFDQAIEEFPRNRINEVFPNGNYSSWALLEHIKRTQSDILEFIKENNYKEKEWPKDYWPDSSIKADEHDWKKTIEEYKKDLRDLEEIVNDEKIDLYKEIPWGEGQNILREIQLVADHSSYHIGEFAIMRQVMGTWGKGH